MLAVINMQEQPLPKTRKISGGDVVIQVPGGVTIIRATMVGVKEYQRPLQIQRRKREKTG